MVLSGSVAVPFSAGASSVVVALGYTAAAASSVQCFASGYRTVLIITGKGFKSRERDVAPWEQVEEPGVLRRKLPEWLGLSEFSQYVSGFATSHARHGGSGAFYVTLRVRNRDWRVALTG